MMTENNEQQVCRYTRLRHLTVEQLESYLHLLSDQELVQLLRPKEIPDEIFVDVVDTLMPVIVRHARYRKNLVEIRIEGEAAPVFWTYTGENEEFIAETTGWYTIYAGGELVTESAICSGSNFKLAWRVE